MSSWSFGLGWERKYGSKYGSNSFLNVNGFPGLVHGLWSYPPEVLARLQGPSSSPLSQPKLSRQTVGPERAPGVISRKLGPSDPSMPNRPEEQEIARLRQQLHSYPQLGATSSPFEALGQPVPTLSALPTMFSLPTVPKDQKVQLLKQQAHFLQQQLEFIQKQLNELTQES